MAEDKTDWGTVAIGVGAAALVGGGLYLWFTKTKQKEGEPIELSITSYENLDTGQKVQAPKVIDVQPGDTVKVNFQYHYYGPAVSGVYYVAVWKKTLFDPHDEYSFAELPFNIPETPSDETITGSIDITVDHPAMTPGKYGLYMKLAGLPEATLYVFLADVISYAVGEDVEYKPARTELLRQSFNIAITPSGYLEANTELARKSFSIPIVVSGYLPANVELARKPFSVTVTTQYMAPVAETLPADNIGGDSADVHGRLVSAGSHDIAKCWIQWGRTTTYGYKSENVWLHSGDIFDVKLIGLIPDTTYHFRAVAETSLGISYGADRSFKTLAIVTPGFTMRVINPPTGATQWRAGNTTGAPAMPTLQPFSYVWNYTSLVPDYEVNFFVTAAGPWQDSYAPTIKTYIFPFRLRNGKKYVFDFALEVPDLRLKMLEE